MATKLVFLIFSIVIFNAAQQCLFQTSETNNSLPIVTKFKYAVGSKQIKERQSSSIGENNFIVTKTNVQTIKQVFSDVQQRRIPQTTVQQSRTKMALQSGGASSINDRPKIIYSKGKTPANYYDQSRAALHIDHRMVKRDESNFCYEQGICKSNENYTFKSCYCDADCTSYKDCCLDVKHYENKTTEPEKFQYTGCVNIDIPVVYGGGANRGFYMVTKCPFEDRKCDQNENEIPVTDNNGINYKNEYCAQCHGIEHYRYWNIVFLFDTCRSFDYTSIRTTKVADRIETLKQQKCSMYLVPPIDLHENKTTFPRSCIISVKKYQKEENSTLCHNFANTVFSVTEQIFIKNIYCVDITENIGNILCVKSTNVYEDLFLSDTGTFTDYGPMPMTVMFQIHPNDKDSADNCAISELLNTNQALTDCWDEKCNSSIQTEVCSEEFVRNYHLHIPVTLQSNSVHSVTALERALLLYFLSLPIDFYRIKLLSIMGMISCNEKIRLNEPNGCCIIRNIVINAAVGRKLKPKETGQLRSDILGMKFVYTERDDSINASHTRVENVLQRDNISCEFDDGNITGNSIRTILLYPLFKWFRSVIVFDKDPLINYTQVPLVSNIKATVKQESEFLMDYNFLTTSMFSMAVNEWVMEFPDRVLNSAPTLTLNSTFIQTVITYTTMGISSAALLITVGIYAYFEMYKQFADYVSITTMSVLLLANLLFMSGIGATGHDVLCTIIGMILHYLWLCVFSWVNLFSGLVIMMLVRLGRNEPVMELTKTYASFLGYGIPLLIVIPSIILSRLQVDSLEIRYNLGICFITGFPANLIFFSGPLLLSIVINFIILVVAFKEFSKHNYNLTSQNTVVFKYIAPYIRLCLMSVIFWVFGILAQALKNDVLGYFFVIACGSQGLIISLCFLTSTNIRRNIRICRHKKYLSQSSSVRKTDDVELNDIS